MRKHTYVSAEKFILSREFFGMKLGLQNISEFMAVIGSPQLKYKTIHLAGTNGKGSTAAMLASIFQAAGYKTGLFTSPHLVSLRERIRVNGKMISRPSVVSFIDNHREELVRRKLSFFEVVTAMALEYFSKVNVDIAIVETGLGGRLDATNILKPELTITTDISRDHLEILGRTIPKIAREKAGIIKNRVPHLVGLLPEKAEEVIKQTCRDRKAPFYKLAQKNFNIHPSRMQLDFSCNGFNWNGLSLSLPGVHQLKNAALALKAISVLMEENLSVSIKAVIDGLARVYWPGRFQVVSSKKQPTLVLDVAHNTAGMRAFVDTFKIVFPERKAHIITGFVKRKEHQKMIDRLSEIAESYSLVPLKTGRSMELKQLINDINWRGKPYKKYGSLETAYVKLSKMSAPDDIIVVIGSHFLVGEFLDKIGV